MYEHWFREEDGREGKWKAGYRALLDDIRRVCGAVDGTAYVNKVKTRGYYKIRFKQDKGDK